MKILDDNRFMKLVNGELKPLGVQNTEKRKILYLKHPSWQDPTSKERGMGSINAVGRVIYNHMDYLQKLGYQVDLLFDGELTQENAKDYDFIHCSFWYQCLRMIRMGIPYILNIHDNNPLLEEKGSDFYDVYSKCIEQSLVTVAQTDQAKEQWSHLSHKILTVPVPINTDYLTIDDSIEREDFVLCAAAVQTIKGHRYLARACNDLKLKLVVIGNPDDEDEVEALKHQIAHSDGRITWLDKSIPFDELIDYYRRCRVFAMTTKMDVPGLVYLEALSCGANVVATEQGDYKSENPKIARCTLENESIKHALMNAWFMEHDSIGREYVINKHHPKKCVELYNDLVYNGNWSIDHNMLVRSSALYDMDFSDPEKITMWYGRSPFDVSGAIEYDFRVFQEGEITWSDNDKLEDGIGIFRTWSSGWVKPDLEFKYEIKLKDVLIETGKGKNENVERTFHVNDFEFLRKGSNRFSTIESNNNDVVMNEDIYKYIDQRIRGKQWELYVDSIGTGLELYSWPLLNGEFCSELIEKAEQYGQWTTDRHVNYPTHDILLSSFGYGDIWDTILDEYAHPVVSSIWGLQG